MERYIEGYKSFYPGLITNNGVKFEIEVPLHVDGKIKSGPINGNGFHLCLNFEDTFRYIENPILCEVVGYGIISEEFQDYYNDYYDIYACSDMVIKRIIPRSEVIEMAKKLNDERLKRFIITYNMTDDEVKELLSISQSDVIKEYIDYYHNKNENTFKVKGKR